MSAIIIFRLFAGFLIQTIPFAILSIFPHREHYRWSRRIVRFRTALLLIFLDCIFTALCSTLYYFYSEDDFLFPVCNIIFMILLIPCIIYYFYIVKSFWAKKLFIISYSLTMALMTTSISNIINENDGIGYYEDNLPYSLGSLLYLSIAGLLLLPLFYGILSRYYSSIAEQINNKLSRRLSVIAILLFILLGFFLTTIDYSQLTKNTQQFEMAIYCLSSIPLMYYFMFLVLYYSFQNDHLEISLHRAHKQLNFRDEQYYRLQKNIKTHRELRHNIRHNLQVIYGYLTAKDIASAIEYLQEYDNTLNQLSMQNFCEHSTINILLQYYSMQFSNIHTTFTPSIRCPDELMIEKPDLAVIIGNLLDNALEASKALLDQKGSPSVRFSILLVNNSLVITMDNAYDGKIIIKKDHLQTTKEGHTGLGLISIEQIAKKYHGNATFTCDTKNESACSEFHSSIVLYF